MVERGPSQTAQRVAAHRLAFDRRTTPYGRAIDDDLLARDVASAVVVQHEGMHRYLAARTAFFDDQVVDAIGADFRQVVILGAGYDGRSLRYAHPGVAYFEVDLAATQRDKLARLARLGIEVSPVAFVACDFSRDDVASCLRGAGFEPTPALFVLEGVVSYLDDGTLATLLASIASVATAGSRLALSVGLARDDADPTRRDRVAAFRAVVAAMGEPVRSTLSRDAIATVLESSGWSVDTGTEDGRGAALAATRSLGLVVARR